MVRVFFFLFLFFFFSGFWCGSLSSHIHLCVPLFLFLFLIIYSLLLLGLNFVRNGRQGNSGGFHVHTGTSCQHADSVGGHFYDTTTETKDPWSPTKWSTETNEILLNKTPKTLNEMLGRTVVVHASSGKRIGCGVLRDRPHGLSETFSVETPTTITVKNSANDCQQLEQGRSHEIFWTVEGGVVVSGIENGTKKIDTQHLLLAHNLCFPHIFFFVLFFSPISCSFYFSVYYLFHCNFSKHSGNGRSHHERS